MELRTFVCIGVLFLSFGCGNPINIKTAENYANAAVRYANAGDWEKAQMYYGRAWINAKIGRANPQMISVLRYEYGRASGVICEWDEAELALNEAFELDVKSNGPHWMSLVELERMSVAQKDYKKAKKYFDKLMPIMKEMQGETRDPLGYADILDEYVLVLENSGEADEARKHRQRAKQLRDTFPEQKPHSEITPYGTQCKKMKP